MARGKQAMSVWHMLTTKAKSNSSKDIHMCSATCTSMLNPPSSPEKAQQISCRHAPCGHQFKLAAHCQHIASAAMSFFRGPGGASSTISSSQTCQRLCVIPVSQAAYVNTCTRTCQMAPESLAGGMLASCPHACSKQPRPSLHTNTLTVI